MRYTFPSYLQEVFRPWGAQAQPVVVLPVPHRWLVLLLLGAVLFARQPLDFLTPQLNAEEGAIFFQEAYNQGFFASFFSSEAGYYHLLLRLTAGLALLVPLELVPFVFKIVSFAIQMLPVAYLLADGMPGFVATPLFRVAVAVLYVAGPNSSEIYVNANNSQWHLTLAACLILLCGRRSGKVRNVLDTGVLILFALSGPFSLICVPLALWRWWRDGGLGGQGARNCGPIIVLLGAVVEAAYLFSGHRLGAGPEQFTGTSLMETIRIVGLHGTFNSLLGMHFMWRHAAAFPNWAFVAAAAAIPLLGVAMLNLRKPALVVLGALAASSVAVMFLFPLNDPRLWLNPAFGPRYFFFATIAILYTLLAMVERGGWSRRIAAPWLAVAMICGMRGDFSIPALPDSQWQEQIAVFRTLPAGKKFYIPIHPHSDWGITLVRKAGPKIPPPAMKLEVSKRPLLASLAPVMEVNPIAGERMVNFEGIAVDPTAGTAADGITLVVDGRLFPAVTGIVSQQPRATNNDPVLLAARFSRLVPSREIGPGVHRVEVWAHGDSSTRVQKSAPVYFLSTPTQGDL